MKRRAEEHFNVVTSSMMTSSQQVFVDCPVIHHLTLLNFIDCCIYWFLHKIKVKIHLRAILDWFRCYQKSKRIIGVGCRHGFTTTRFSMTLFL